MATLFHWLNDVPIAGLMLVVALGFWLGRLQWKGLSLGPAGGTILVALVLGRLGLSFEHYYGGAEPAVTIGLFGFCLFIYSVGFEAGPRFFTSLFGGPGWRFVVVAGVVNAAALGLAVAAGRLLDLGPGVSAGLLAGALTSPPTYAAAAEVAVGARNELALTFAVTYPVGLAAVVLLVQFLPRLMGDDLSKDITENDDDGAAAVKKAGATLTRAFDVTHPEVIGPTLAELNLTNRTGCSISRLHRGDEVRAVDAQTTLEAGDHILVRGRFEELQDMEALVGPEVYDEELRKRMQVPRKIRITQGPVVGKTLAEMQLAKRHRSWIVNVDRGGVLIEPSAELALQRGDVLHVAGPRDGVRGVAQLVGRFERSTSETDIAVYAGGILLGVLVGSFKLPLFGGSLTLGLAGGLLLAGVVLGRFRNVGIIHVHVPRAARQLVRDLGVLLLVAEAGVLAGRSSHSGDMGESVVAALMACLAVTALSILIAVAVARWILKLRPVDAWGSLGGGMTSSAALTAVRRAADSNEPALSYAASYAVASVLATIAGQVILYLL